MGLSGCAERDGPVMGKGGALVRGSEAQYSRAMARGLPQARAAGGAAAQVVVDVWDCSSQGGRPDLLGKAVMSVSECRPGVPHTFFKNMLRGKLVRLPPCLRPLPCKPRPAAFSRALRPLSAGVAPPSIL